MKQPFFYLVVWRDIRNSLVLIGQEIDLKGYSSRLRHGYKLTSFSGRKATVCVITDDETIPYNAKLDFASMFMRGDYERIEINLKDLTGSVSVGKPPP